MCLLFLQQQSNFVLSISGSILATTSIIVCLPFLQQQRVILFSVVLLVVVPPPTTSCHSTILVVVVLVLLLTLLLLVHKYQLAIQYIRLNSRYQGDTSAENNARELGSFDSSFRIISAEEPNPAENLRTSFFLRTPPRVTKNEKFVRFLAHTSRRKKDNGCGKQTCGDAVHKPITSILVEIVF